VLIFRDFPNPSSSTATALSVKGNTWIIKKYSFYLSSIFNLNHTLIKCSKVNFVKILRDYVDILVTLQALRKEKERIYRKQKRSLRRPKLAK